MKLADLIPSSFLTKEDFDKPQLLTIDRIEFVNVAPQGQPEERKPVMHFLELDRGLVLNKTNVELLAHFLGNEPDNWPGQKIVAYHDPSVSYAGKRVGGIRLRAPKQTQPAQPAASQANPMADLENDIPY